LYPGTLSVIAEKDLNEADEYWGSNIFKARALFQEGRKVFEQIEQQVGNNQELTDKENDFKECIKNLMINA
jgi:hypothetical protein